jgi:translation initiation factor 1 (eIF-1/SUI1)
MLEKDGVNVKASGRRGRKKGAVKKGAVKKDAVVDMVVTELKARSSSGGALDAGGKAV